MSDSEWFLSCIDYVVVIWREYCGVGQSKNLKNRSWLKNDIADSSTLQSKKLLAELIIWEKVIQEVQLSRREASNVNGIWLLSVLRVGCLQQDEVGHPHQVQVVEQCQIRGGATDLPPLLAGQFYRTLYFVCEPILRWLSLEALLGFLSDFPSWASLMLSPISRAVPSMFYMRGPLWSGNKRVFAFFFLL